MADNTRQRLGFQPVKTDAAPYLHSVSKEGTLPQEGQEETPALVSDYLDHLTAGLLKLPYAEREAIRTEVRLHLLASIAAFEEIGEPQEQAIRQAMAQFGNPGRLAQGFMRSWESTGRNRHAFPRATMFHAMRFFGPSALLVFLFLSILMQIPNPVADAGSVSFCVFVGVPIWGGWRMSIYRRAALGTFYGIGALATAMIPILIFAELLPLSLAHLPYLAAICAGWAPIAAISAAVSQLYNRWRPSEWRLT